ncbi:MAG: Gfo/Idh/MocA family oxidoreductase [Candidatus Poribacteria bacterium]|nr:Gfo/Idh/MocA family oxidoreductase [Candidatus Poribacteria bacterium]
MANQTINLGVVGCGWAGRQAVLAATAVPRTTVVAVADLDATRRDSVAGEFSLSHAYADYHELLNNSEIDAVYLATSPDGRLRMVLDTLHAGKHVLVQKPHAIRASEILEMDATAKKTGKTLQFCYFMRHFPNNRKIRRAALAGKIGAVYHARIFGKYNTIPPLNDNTRWLHVYGQKGGSLGQHYSHELDLAWWWMGCPQPEWAFAAAHAVYPVYDGPEGPAEDYFTGLVGFEGNRTIQIDCSRMVHTPTPTIVELYGSTGAITGGAISRFRDSEFIREEIDEPLEIEHSNPPENPPVFYYEVEHFAMAIAGAVEPDVSAADAYTFMKILDAFYDSAREQKKISVE